MNVLMPFLSAVPQWVSDSFPILRIVMIVLMALVGLAIIVIVLFQPSNSDLGSAYGGGGSDTYYSKNKGKTLESTMKRITVILGIVEAVLSILFFVSLIIYSGSAS